jgi:hypothetical protein
VSCHCLGDRLTRSANWFIFKAWPRVQRWLWVLHRVALFVAFVLSLIALLITICQHGLSDWPRDSGAVLWTTRVWAADRDGGVTIRATTGRAIPEHRPHGHLGELLSVVPVLLVVLAMVSATNSCVGARHGNT